MDNTFPNPIPYLLRFLERGFCESDPVVQAIRNAFRRDVERPPDLHNGRRSLLYVAFRWERVTPSLHWRPLDPRPGRRRLRGRFLDPAELPGLLTFTEVEPSGGHR